MKPKRAIIWLLALFMVCLSKVAWADIYAEQEIVTNYQVDAAKGISKTSHQRLYLKQDMLRIEEVESGKITIVRLDEKLIFAVFKYVWDKNIKIIPNCELAKKFIKKNEKLERFVRK